MTKAVFAFSYRKNSFSIPCEEILYIKKSGRKAYLYTKDKEYVFNMNLEGIWGQLDTKLFAAIIFVSAFLLSIVSTTGYLGWNLICSILMIYLYGTNYQLTKIQYFILPVFYLGIRFVTEPVGILLLDCFNNLTPNMLEPVRAFFSTMVCECIRLLIVIMIKKYWKIRLIELPLIVSVFLCAIPVWGIISCCILIYTVCLYEMPGERLLCIEIIFIVIFTNIMAFVVFQKIRKVFYDMHQNEVLIQEAKLKEEYYQALDQSNQQIKKYGMT